MERNSHNKTDRELAYLGLTGIDIEGRLAHEVLKETLDGCSEKNNKGFVARLIRGVTERKLTLEYILEKQSGRKLKSIKPQVRVIISMGLYQLLFMNVPESAAVNESVKLCRRHGLNGLSGFVNAVLRGFIRKAEELGVDFSRETDNEGLERIYAGLSGGDNDNGKDQEIKKLSFMSSTPTELIQVLDSYLGRNETEKMLIGALDAENVLTVYKLKTAGNTEEFEGALTEDGIEFEKLNDAANAYILKAAGNITESRAFKQGMFIVQNISSMLASELVPVTKNMKVLDVCAAPGGKAVHLADRIKEAGGRVAACDLTAGKTAKILETVKRCGLDNVDVLVQDAAEYKPEFEDAFDVLVCDLPCSGLGVIAGKPDIKYKTKPEDIAALSLIQRTILKNVDKYLKEGGYMVYSTCTLTKQENEDNTGYIRMLGYSEEKTVKLLPDGKQDGFYISVMKKAGKS